MKPADEIVKLGGNTTSKISHKKYNYFCVNSFATPNQAKLIIMSFPPIFPIGFATLQYVILGYTVLIGMLQIYHSRFQGAEVKKSKTLWLGAMSVVVGAIAYFQSYREAMEAIGAAGDISPSLVADSMSHAFDFPILGLANLGLAFLIRYLID